jgi:hypothetical protein
MDVDQETSQTAVLASSAGQPSESALTTMKPYEPQFAPAEPNADSSSIATRAPSRRTANFTTTNGPRMTIIDLAEARRAKRRQVLDMGLIRFGDMSVSCVLRDLSEVGAALDVGPQRRYSGSVHVDRCPEEENLFVQRHVAHWPSHWCGVPPRGRAHRMKRHQTVVR